MIAAALCKRGSRRLPCPWGNPALRTSTCPRHRAPECEDSLGKLSTSKSHLLHCVVNDRAARKYQEVSRFDIEATSELVEDVDGRKPVTSLDPAQVALGLESSLPRQFLLREPKLLTEVNDPLADKTRDGPHWSCGFPGSFGPSARGHQRTLVFEAGAVVVCGATRMMPSVEFKTIVDRLRGARGRRGWRDHMKAFAVCTSLGPLPARQPALVDVEATGSITRGEPSR